MPARIVDGDAIASSQKLRKVLECFRIHYAYWLTLMEANGVFEADPDTIWRALYAILMPAMTPAIVRQIRDEFVRVGLLVVWQEGDKEYGWFTGSDKPGRLPPKGHLSRYKNLPPDPPEKCKSLKTIIPDNPGTIPELPGVFRTDPEGFGFGLDRIGVGLEGKDNPKTNEENLSMTVRKHIEVECYKVLGIKAELSDYVWEEIQTLTAAFGAMEVKTAFDEWVAGKVGEVTERPVAAFLKIAAGILRGTIEAKENPELKNLINQMTFHCQGKILFGDKHRAVISKLLKTYSAAEILDAFKKFYDERSDSVFELRRGAQNFVETAEQLLNLARTNRAYLDAQKALADKLAAQERAKADEEVRAAKQRAAEADAKIEDELG